MKLQSVQAAMQRIRREDVVLSNLRPVFSLALKPICWFAIQPTVELWIEKPFAPTQA